MAHWLANMKAGRQKAKKKQSITLLNVKNTKSVGQVPTRGINIGMNIEDLKKLAGINEFKGYTPYEGSNISVTGTEKRRIEREKNIKPGDKEWFELWFNLPYMTGALNTKPGFRGRKK